MNTTNNKQGLVKGAMILSVGVLVSRIIGLLYRIPIRNILGDKGQSLYGIAYSIYIVILTLTAMAMPGALSKLIAERRAAGAYKEAQRVFKLALVYSVIFSAVLALGLWVSADFIDAKFFTSQDVAMPIRALAPTVVIATVLGVLRGYFQGRGDMAPTAFSQVIEQVFNVIFSVVLAAYFMKITNKNIVLGATGSALGTGAGAIAGLCIVTFLYFRNRKTDREEVAHSRGYKHQSSTEILKQILNMMVPVIVTSAIFSVVTFIDQSMISSLLPKGIETLRNSKELGYVPVADAAIYSTSDIASQLSGQLSFQYSTFMNIPISLILQLGMASVPAIAESMALGQVKDVRKKTRMILKVGMLIAAPCAFGFMIYAKPILMLLSIDTGSQLLSQGAIAILPIAIAQLSAGILQGMSKQALTSVNALIACVIKVILNFVFLLFPRFNVFGFVHSTTICYIIYAALNMHYLTKHLKMKVNWKKILIKPVICAAVMGMISFPVYAILLHLGLSMKIAIIFVIPFAALIYFMVGLATHTIAKNDLMSIPGGSRLVSFLQRG